MRESARCESPDRQTDNQTDRPEPFANGMLTAANLNFIPFEYLTSVHKPEWTSARRAWMARSWLLENHDDAKDLEEIRLNL